MRRQQTWDDRPKSKRPRQQTLYDRPNLPDDAQKLGTIVPNSRTRSTTLVRSSQTPARRPEDRVRPGGSLEPLTLTKVSPGIYIYGEDIARFALDGYFERPTTHFTIGREPLGRQAGVQQQLVRLTAERTLYGLAVLHYLQETSAALVTLHRTMG